MRNMNLLCRTTAVTGFIILLLISVCIPLTASEYRFSSLSMETGLSNNSVFTMAQDSLGYIWIGTFGGLNRFDGNEYKIYKPDPARAQSITSSVIFDIFEDSRGRVWIGTDGGGLNLYDRENDSFSSYRFDPADPSTLSSDQVFSIFEDSSGTLWVGTGGGGLNRMTPEGTFVPYMADSSVRNALHSNIIRKIIQDHEGVLWIGTDGGGLSRYLPDQDQFMSFYYRHEGLDDEQKVCGDSVKALFEDSEYRLWVGFESAGLALFDPCIGSSPLWSSLRIPQSMFRSDPSGRMHRVRCGWEPTGTDCSSSRTRVPSRHR